MPPDLAILEGSDAVLVGGSDGVTAENTLETIRSIADRFPDKPVLQEPYSSSHVSEETVDAADALAVPAVYNGDRANFVGKHVEFFSGVGSKPGELLGAGVPILGEVIASKGKEAVSQMADVVVGEGYVIQNPDSRAAAVSDVEETYSSERVAGAALATEAFYGVPVFYPEYSGTDGGTDDGEAAAAYLEETTVLYGGRIDSERRTSEILDAGARRGRRRRLLPRRPRAIPRDDSRLSATTVRSTATRPAGTRRRRRAPRGRGRRALPDVSPRSRPPFRRR